MKTIDTAVLAGYNAGIERDRLRTGEGLLEFERTKEILLEKLPKPPAVIYDIGGAYGEYAWWLAFLGYEVHLFDLSETNIAMSTELAAEYPGVRLASSTVSDARSIPRPDKSADAVLLMGPLYSITEYEERILAIKESHRLLKDEGLLFSAALTPYSPLIPRLASYHKETSRIRYELDDPAVMSMIERALKDGCYINPEMKIINHGLGSSHLHTAKALREELSAGGFNTASVHGIMGGAWLAPNLDTLLANDETKAVLMKTVRMLDTHEEIIGLSGHLLAVSRKKTKYGGIHMKFVLIVGDGAVGKMTVGQELMKITGLRLFHNHMTIEPVLEIFNDFNIDVILKLRYLIFEEFVKTDNYGMIYTCMWAYDCPEDWEIMTKILGIFESAGAELYCVELTAPLDVRLKRNVTENRLKIKASKGDVEASNARLIWDTENHRFVSRDGEVPIRNFMRIDNSDIEPNVVAKMIKDEFDL